MAIFDRDSIYEDDVVSRAMLQGIKTQLANELKKDLMVEAEEKVNNIVEGILRNFDAKLKTERDLLQDKQLIRFSYMLSMATVAKELREQNG